MNEELISKIEEMLVVLCEMHSKKITPAFIAIYRQKLLSKLSPEEALSAIDLAFTSKTYGFPKVYDLIELIRGKDSDQWIMAWGEVQDAIQKYGRYQSVLFTDPKITRTLELMGGWQDCCNWPLSELKYRRNEFCELYNSLNGHCEQKVMPGLHEIENAARGYLDSIPAPIVIGDGRVLIGLPKTKRQLLVDHCINTVLNYRKLEEVDEEPTE